MIAQNTIAKPVSRLRGILLAALACLMPALVQAQAALLSEYRFDDVPWCTPVSALDTVGGRNGSLIGGVAWEDSPASGGKPVNGAAARFAGGAIDITGLPFNLAAGAKNSVSFWMFWDGTNSVMPIGFQSHDLWLYGGSFGFNTFSSDIFGISSAGLASGWHHVAAVFTNGNVAGNKIWIDGVAQVLTQRTGAPNNGNAVVNAHMRISGVWGTSGYLFQGVLDAVRVYSGEMTQAQVDADRAASYATVVCPPPPPAVLLSEYRFDDVAWCTPLTALDTASTRNGTLIGSVAWEDSPASGGKPVAGAAARFAGTGAIDITGMPFDLAAGGRNSVSFWMYWDGTNSVMPLGFGTYDLWLQGGSFGFNTFNGDIYGIASAGLAGGWRHVAAVFTNGGVSGNKIWIDGVAQTLTQRASTPNAGNANISSHLRISGVWGSAGYQFTGFIDGARLYSGVITQAQVDADRAASYPAVVCPPPPPPTPVAHFRLDDNWDVTHAAANEVGGGPAAALLAPYATRVATPAAPPTKPDTCFGAQFSAATGSMRTTGVSLDLVAGGKNSISFWMLWNGGNNQMPFGFALHDLWLVNGNFGFNSAGGDLFGIASAGLAGTWHHVAAVFTNGNIAANKLWIDGVPQTLSQKQGAPNNGNAYAANTFQLSSWTNDNNYRFNGTLDELKVYRGALTDALVLADYAASCASTVPGRFNAYEPVAVPPYPTTGSIRTKVSGTSFPLDIVALDAAGTAIETGFNDNVKIELVGNATDINVPLDGNGCPTSYTVLNTIASQALVNGRAASVGFAAVANAWRDARVRISWPVAAPTVVRCSADRFAVRPDAFANFSVSDTDWQSAGTARALNDVTFGSVTHKAGRPFSVRADAVNSASVITGNYAGSPTATLSACGGVACTAGFGALSLATAFGAGQLASDVASYNEAGSFSLQMTDDTFASVDAADGSTAAERNITSAVINAGRFVPDHFAAAFNAPVFGTACGAGSFTYVGQAFNYTIAPVIVLTAQGFANNTTTFYADPTKWWRITDASLTGKAYTAATGTLDSSGITGSDPVIAVTGSGTGTLTFASGTGLFFTRTTPVAPFNADISLSINVIDADGVAYTVNPAAFGAATAGNGIAFTVNKEMRFGRLRLANANGSELLPLSMRMTTQYYTAGAGFVDNVADNCTTIAAPNVGLGNYQPPLIATVPSIAGGAFVNGVKTLTLSAPGAGNYGAVDVVIDLGPTTINTCIALAPVPAPTGANLAFLRDLQYCSAGSYDRDPTARATFGAYDVNRNFIYLRENY